MVALNASTYFGSITVGQYILLQSVYLPIGICSILGNSLVLITYFKYKQLRNADCAHLIAGLAFGDFISGIGAIIVGLARMETGIFCDFNYTRFYCIFSDVPNLFGIEMSQAMTMSIAIDRFLAVTSPFSYRTRNHRRYAIISFVIAILCGCVIILLSTVAVDFSSQPSRCSWTSGITKTSVNIFTLGNVGVPLIVTVIYATVMYKQRQWQKQHMKAGTVDDQSTKKFLAAQAKTTVMLTKLVIIYCALISAPLTAMELWSVLNISPNFYSTVISPLRNIAMSLNSAVNVIVYAHSSSNLRPYLLHLLTCGRYGARSTATTSVAALTTAKKFNQLSPIN